MNDAIEMLEEYAADDLDEQERADISSYKEECQKLIDLLAS